MNTSNSQDKAEMTTPTGLKIKETGRPSRINAEDVESTDTLSVSSPTERIG